jgi:hypothetical protein
MPVPVANCSSGSPLGSEPPTGGAGSALGQLQLAITDAATRLDGIDADLEIQ